MGDKKKITRRAFLKEGKKLIYLTPVIHTFFTEAKEAMAQGRRAARRAAALQRRVDRLERLAAIGNQRAARLLQRLRERLVSPP